MDGYFIAKALNSKVTWQRCNNHCLVGIDNSTFIVAINFWQFFLNTQAI
jgi:Fe-S oxidoreductase